jgi:hypothetical protein
MTLYMRSLGLAHDLLVNNVVGMMVRILLFLQRVRKRPRRVPRVGPSNNRTEVSKHKDMSIVKCFACNKIGHYAGQCPNRKKKKQGGIATSTEEDEFASQFEREMSSLVSLSTIQTPSSVWYIDSGASSHMSGVRENFTDLTEIGIKLEIVLGNNTIVRAVGCGIVSFQRELRPPMVFRDVLYVPGMKKNLISVYTRTWDLRCPFEVTWSLFTLRGPISHQPE